VCDCLFQSRDRARDPRKKDGRSAKNGKARVLAWNYGSVKYEEREECPAWSVLIRGLLLQLGGIFSEEEQDDRRVLTHNAIQHATVCLFIRISGVCEVAECRASSVLTPSCSVVVWTGRINVVVLAKTDRHVRVL
jgi:hypothetical protein